MKSSEVNYAIVISSATLLLLTYVSLLLACIDSCCTFVLLVLIYVFLCLFDELRLGLFILKSK